MKNTYTKTTWIDNKTPVNAANLNHIESALADIYNTAVSSSQLTQGEGIKVTTDCDKNVKISVDNTVMKSDSCTGVEIETSEPAEGYEKGKIYFILDPDTKKLKKIVINAVVVYEVE